MHFELSPLMAQIALLIGNTSHSPSFKSISSVLTEILQNVKVFAQCRPQGYTNTLGFLQKQLS